MNKFEQLIEYVINDDEAKARELFHDIVVDKSRKIYEELMQKDDKELEEVIGMEEQGIKETDEEDDIGGDASDEFMHDVEADSDDADMDADDADMDADDADMDAEADLEDRVVDLEDKLDELMAEFESMMGDGEPGMDDMGGDDEFAPADDLGGDDGLDMGTSDSEFVPADDEESMMENVSLKAVAKPSNSEEGSVNKKSISPANSGAKGALANPVKMTGDTAQGRPNPTAKDLIGKVGNTPAQSSGQKLSAAPKAVTTQSAGVNTKTPFPKA